MSEKLCPDCGGDLTIVDGEYDTNYYCKDPDCRFVAHSDAEYELCCDQKTGDEVIDQLRARITELEADRDSESRWAKEYLARAEAAETRVTELEKIAKTLVEASIAFLQEISGDGRLPDDVVAKIADLKKQYDAAKDGPP
jgi:ssDNA-binding Zn-finger/Zn-ribbon topoisomerase 1